MEEGTKFMITVIVFILSFAIGITVDTIITNKFKEKMATLGYCQSLQPGSQIPIWIKCTEAK